MAQTDTKVIKGFIKDYAENILLPITRAELVLDQAGKPALHSEEFLAQVPDASIPGDKGLPGLITAAEKALLHTLDGGNGGGSGTISDIYSALDTLFGTSLSFNGTPLNYYTNKTANTINIKNEEGIAINVSRFDVSIGLAPLTGETDDTTINKVVTGITVDKFGRVTNVSGSSSLSEITLSGATITETIAELTSDKAVVSKEYVDSKFNTVNTIATGALRFGSVLQEGDLATLWSQKDSKINYYYKFGCSGEIPAGQVFGQEGSQPFKIGDTVIVHHIDGVGTKFVYVPSGDEPITTLTVRDSDTKAIENIAGNIELNFTGAINVSSTENSTTKATIEVPILSNNNSTTVNVGALTRDDYNKFQLASSKSMSYDATVEGTMTGAYEIGKIVLGDSDRGVSIYGLNDTYQLQVKQNEIGNIKDSINPFISLTSFNEDVSKIQIIGEKGIIAASANATDGSVSPIIKLGLQYKETYLKLDDTGKLDVKIGSYVEGVKTDGLVDYATFISYTSTLYQDSVKFEAIENSLKGTAEGDEYRYGNDVLIKAIGGKRSNGSADWDILVI